MIERFTFELFHCNGGYMTPDAEGEYVSYEDYAALQQKLDAMAEESAELKSAANALIKTSEECEINGDEIKHVVGTDEFENLFDCVDKTPATNAYLNSVRAEGVEMFANEKLKLRELHSGNRDIEMVKANDYAAMSAQEFAEQLRSGPHDTADKAGAK